MKNTAIVLILFLALGIALAATVRCPIHNHVGTFTGKAQIVDGKILYEYSCPRGHMFWVVK